MEIWLIKKHLLYLRHCFKLSCENEILEIPDYIKIDVDGIEHLILSGANKFLKNEKIKGICVGVMKILQQRKVSVIC